MVIEQHAAPVTREVRRVLRGLEVLAKAVPGAQAGWEPVPRSGVSSGSRHR